jgi:hypothetical protein
MPSPTGTERISAGGLDGLALFDLGLAEDHGADGLLVEVQREADGAVLELEELVDGAVGEARLTRAMPSPTSSTRPTCAGAGAVP